MKPSASDHPTLSSEPNRRDLLGYNVVKTIQKKRKIQIIRKNATKLQKRLIEEREKEVSGAHPWYHDPS